MSDEDRMHGVGSSLPRAPGAGLLFITLPNSGQICGVIRSRVVWKQMRVMRIERELETVRSERDRNELYLMRILREVDQKVSRSRFAPAVEIIDIDIDIDTK